MKVVNLTKIYKVKNGEPVKALDGVTFDLPQKGMVFLTGKSGSGKTTLLNLLSGLDTFDDGDIILGDKSLKGFSGKEADSYRNGCCGFVFQDYNLLPEFTVAENVSLALEIQGKQASEEEISQALKSVDLEGYENRKVTELSGGQKQRIAIVRALVKNPEVIFADEPTGALDSKTSDDILSLLKKLSEQKLVVVVSHEQEFAQKYADRIIELKDGKILSDTAAEFCENDGEKQRLRLQQQPPNSKKRCRLPIKTALKIGIYNLKLDKFKIAVVIVLCVISFTALGCALTPLFFDAEKAFVDYTFDESIKYLFVRKYYNYPDKNLRGLDIFLSWEKPYSQKSVSLTKTDVEKIGANANQTVIPVCLARIYSVQKHIAAEYGALNDFTKKTGKQIDIAPEGYAYFSQAAINEHGYLIEGMLPQSKDEVAITTALYNAFTVRGFKDGESIFPIDSPSDLIGKKMIVSSQTSGSDSEHLKTITGVVDTGEKFVSTVFVSCDYLDEYTYVKVTMPQTKNDYKNFAHFLYSHKEPLPAADEFFDYQIESQSSPLFVAFASAVFFADEIQVLFAYLSALFFVVTFAFLLKAISNMADQKTKQIGILRSMGVGFCGTTDIFVLSALVLLMIVFAVSLVTVPICNAVLNRVSQKAATESGVAAIRVFQITPMPYVILFAISLIIAFVGGILPLLKTAKTPPSETIRKGQKN